MPRYQLLSPLNMFNYWTPCELIYLVIRYYLNWSLFQLVLLIEHELLTLVEFTHCCQWSSHTVVSGVPFAQFLVFV